MRITNLHMLLILWLLFIPNLFADDVGSIPPPTNVSAPQPGTSSTSIVQQPVEIDPEAQPSTTTPTPDAQTLGAPSGQGEQQDHYMQEKCQVLDADGNGLIKPYRADSGINLQGDANAWIWVPYGECKKINAGDFHGVSQEIRDKIDASNIHDAQTLD